jgi:Tfp pilus assembly pilus retraction ATPase PilT
MSNFDINEEIDKLVDKFASKLKTQLKSAVAKSEKQILKQYITAQKDTSKTIKSTKNTKINSTTVSSGSKKTSPRRTGAPKREVEYANTSDSDSDESR